MDRSFFSIWSFLTRQMLPAMMKSREGRMTVRATIQGDVLGIKGSEKGAQKSHLVRERSPGIRALPGADLKSASPAPLAPTRSLLRQLLFQKPQLGKETVALHWLTPQ